MKTFLGFREVLLTLSYHSCHVSGDGKASRSRRKVTYSDDPRTPPKKQSRKSKKHSRQKVADNLNRAKDAYQKGEVTKDMFGPQRRYAASLFSYQDPPKYCNMLL